jgi:cell division septation protein DedD
MKTIRCTSLTLLLMFSLLSISVMGAGGQGSGIRIAPANEDFTVWMPDTPRVVGTKQLIMDRQPLTVSYYCLVQDGTEYAVLSVSGLESKQRDLAHMLMLNLYSSLLPTAVLEESNRSAVSIKANYQRDISLNGYPGREFSIQAHQRTGLWRFYSVGRRFYAVAVSTTRQDNTLIDRFLDSFTLGEPAPTSATIRKEPVQSQPNISAQATPPASATVQKEPVQSKPNVPVRPQPNTSAQGTPSARPSSRETWLIILSTFSKAERSKADEKMRLFRSLGYDAQLVDTDSYPNLRKGFLAVVIGPHSKSAAEGILNKVRSAAPGSYIKPGW